MTSVTGPLHRILDESVRGRDNIDRFMPMSITFTGPAHAVAVRAWGCDRFVQHQPISGRLEAPAYCGRRDLDAVCAQKQHGLVLAGTRPALAHRHDRPEQFRAVARSSAGPAAALFRALQVACLVTRPPRVEALPAYFKMLAGQSDLAAVAIAELETLKSQPTRFGKLHRRLRQAQEL